MFKVKNRMKQEYPLDVVKNGKHKRVFVSARESVETEEITSAMKKLEKKRKIYIKEIKDNEE